MSIIQEVFDFDPLTCKAIVVHAVLSISERTGLDIESIMNCLAESDKGLPENPTDEEFIASTLAFRKALNDLAKGGKGASSNDENSQSGCCPRR